MFFLVFLLFLIWVFFHQHSHSRRKGTVFSLVPLYQLHQLHKHLDISWEIGLRAHHVTQLTAGLDSGTFSFLTQATNLQPAHPKQKTTGGKKERKTSGIKQLTLAINNYGQEIFSHQSIIDYALYFVSPLNRHWSREYNKV